MPRCSEQPQEDIAWAPSPIGYTVKLTNWFNNSNLLTHIAFHSFTRDWPCVQSFTPSPTCMHWCIIHTLTSEEMRSRDSIKLLQLHQKVKQSGIKWYKINELQITYLEELQILRNTWLVGSFWESEKKNRVYNYKNLNKHRAIWGVSNSKRSKQVQKYDMGHSKLRFKS